MRHTCVSSSNGALDKLVTTHGALVRAIAVNIHSKLPVHVELCDLVQEGMRGLIDAAKRYDPRRGVAFTTYAKYRVRGAILDGLRQFDPASRAFRTTSKKLDAAAHELADELGRTPTESEVAARAAVDLTRWTQHSETSRALRPASLTAEDGSGPVPEVAGEGPSEEASAMHAELQRALKAVMSRLPRPDPGDRHAIPLARAYDARNRPPLRPQREPRLPDPQARTRPHGRRAPGARDHGNLVDPGCVGEKGRL